MNLTVLKGRLSRPAERRTLPSGDAILYLDLTIGRAGNSAETVNVVWFDAPAWASGLDVDDEVLAVGRVRRRFYRQGPQLQSRTEVVADAVVRAGRAKQRQALLTRALGQLQEAASG